MAYQKRPLLKANFNILPYNILGGTAVIIAHHLGRTRPKSNRAVHAVGVQAAKFNLILSIMSKVKLGWSLLTIPQKILKANSVRTTMAANADVYTAPDPDLGEIEDAENALIAAEAEAMKGGTDRTTMRNAALFVLTDLMKRLVDYVQLTSGGDEVKIVKAGMEVKKAPEPWPLPLQVKNLEANPGTNAGTVVLTCDATKHKKMYLVEIWAFDDIPPLNDPNTSNRIPLDPWEMLVIQGGREYEAKSLISGKNYRFRVAAQNSAGLGPFSGEAQSVAR